MANNVNVTNRGFEYICQWMNGANPGSTVYPQPNVVGWGTANGSNATSVNEPATGPVQSFPANISTAGTGQWSDVAPFLESAEARVSGTASVTGNTVAGSYSTYQVLATITSSSGQSIGESFLVMSTTKPPSSTISGTMSNVQTSLTTGTALGIVAPYYVQVDNEVMNVTATASSNILTVTRGVNGSAAAAHATGVGITLGNPPGIGGSNPNHGDMMAHAGFQALALNNGDSIAFTWQVNVTS